MLIERGQESDVAKIMIEKANYKEANNKRPIIKSNHMMIEKRR